MATRLCIQAAVWAWVSGVGLGTALGFQQGAGVWSALCVYKRCQQHGTSLPDSALPLAAHWLRCKRPGRASARDTLSSLRPFTVSGCSSRSSSQLQTVDVFFLHFHSHLQPSFLQAAPCLCKAKRHMMLMLWSCTYCCLRSSISCSGARVIDWLIITCGRINIKMETCLNPTAEAAGAPPRLNSQIRKSSSDWMCGIRVDHIVFIKCSLVWKVVF